LLSSLNFLKFVLSSSNSGTYSYKTSLFISISSTSILSSNLTPVTSLYTAFEFVDSDQLIFTNSDRVLLGNLCVLNNTPIRYAENLDIQVNLRYNDKFNADIISWGDISEITESNPFYDVNSGLRHKELQSALQCIIDGEELSLSNIVALNEIRIPVYIDMQRIGNPISKPLNT
jgi:hypothetical protein